MVRALQIGPAQLADRRVAMRALLEQSIAIPSVSGMEAGFVEFLAKFAQRVGLEVDLWQSSEADLGRFPVHYPRHLPLAGRPTAVIRLPGTRGGRSLIFNGHSDVVPTGDVAAWTHHPWGGQSIDDAVFGRGACDTKGPIVSALWSMVHLAESDQRPAGDVLLELVPGEEDCVGLGTLTSVARGWKADGCVVLEPTESLPRCASRGGVRFTITALGRSVHGTVKWLGEDAINSARLLLAAIESLQAEWTTVDSDPLFEAYPFARPLTVDSIRGGDWQGMLADRCVIAGYLELLPADDLKTWQDELAFALRERVGGGVRFVIDFSEQYAGHRLQPDHALCRAAQPDQRGSAWQGFNSGCEAGLRAGLLGTPTLVWGPGSLAQAHAADEFVLFSDVEDVAGQFIQFIERWCNAPTDQTHL
ncbi:MAG: acetylornithine deacetylase [Phycisphaerales bacterium]|nr:acetylornithine deacetylase [Phycisphaerales bacterium]